MPVDGTPKTPFRANLLSLRTLLIFASGFLLALLLARTLPETGLFHPEGRIITKDIVITALNGFNPDSVAFVHGIASDVGSFAADSDVWDGDLLQQAFEMAKQTDNNFRLDARIRYVIPNEGVYATIFIYPRDRD